MERRGITVNEFKVMKNKKIALVGLGGMGARHAITLKSHSSIDLVGGIDLNEERKKAFELEYDVPTFKTLEELLTKCRPDGMILATPPCSREESIQVALAHGIQVLAEKPITHTLSAAKKVAQLAEEHPSVPLNIGYCHRFLDSVQHAKRIISHGGLGRPVWIQIIFSSFKPEMKDRWSTDPKISGGGSAMDNACHALDLFRFLAGESVSISGNYRFSWPGRGEDSFSIVAKSENDILGSFLGSYLTASPKNFWEICGTEGVLRYDYNGKGDELLKIDAKGVTEMIRVEPASKRFQRQLEAWIASMEGAETDLASVQDGLRISELMESLKNQNEPVTNHFAVIT
jgi:predicted dehydrogenase